ncbi:hypothetical protein [uncultured Nonlabens sp.]|uniref:hypothetical protein n=1 Tax=uncultured Nonlabens sp. TaxID=859306 RepID=UPI0026148390|nr:hypothetical protein [uncultured Nonlabens sp.]
MASPKKLQNLYNKDSLSYALKDNNPIDGELRADEYRISGTEPSKTKKIIRERKKNAITTVEHTEEGNKRKMCTINVEGQTNTASTEYFYKPY